MEITRHKRGRPSGQAQANVLKLFQYLSKAPQPVDLATNELTTATGLTAWQFKRALTSLKQDQLVKVVLRRKFITSGWCNQRFIYTLE